MPERMYHGSANPRLKVLKPESGGKDKPVAVYATPRRGLALFFAIKGARWRNIKSKDGEWEVTGLTEDQLDQEGYLYHLNPNKFEQYKSWQYISEEPVKPRRKEKVENIGEELKKMGFKVTPKKGIQEIRK